MNVVLFGATELSMAIAEAVHASSRHELVGVITTRSTFDISFAEETFNVVRHRDLASWAGARRIPTVFHGSSEEDVQFVRTAGGEIGVVAGWYHMVPRSVRAAFPSGCVGVHASLLPRFRGHAPLNWAILTGETETGVSLFELTDEVDEGDLHGQVRFTISPRATIGDLVELAGASAVDLVVRGLDAISGGVRPSPQSGEPTYCLSRIPQDGRIDWTRPALEVDRLVRAVSRPYDGAFSTFEGTVVRVWRVDLRPDAPTVFGAPGQLFRLPGDVRPSVVTGQGMVTILEATGPDGGDLVPLLSARSYRRFA